MRRLVLVTLYRLLSGMHGGMKFHTSRRYGISSWWWAHSCPKHVEKSNKHIKKICAPIWLYLQDYTRMHGQQNIKLFFFWGALAHFSGHGYPVAGVSIKLSFSRKGWKPHAQPPTFSTFVPHLTQNLSDMDGPTCSYAAASLFHHPHPLLCINRTVPDIAVGYCWKGKT
jgi:hypothetical protein